jgi:hypothetical protein
VMSNQVSPKLKLIMKKFITTLSIVAAGLALTGSARAAEDSFVGKWKAQFDSQIGVQKYTYEFKIEDGKLTGKAVGERETGTNDVKIVEGKNNKDEISFVEPLKFNDQEIRIEYTGKIKGDVIKFHRKVGDLAEYDFEAKRVKDDAKADAQPEEKPAAKAGTNAPAGK